MDATTSHIASRPALPRELRIAAAGVLLLVVGAFGPWAKIGELTVTGTAGGKDGTATLILALVAGGLLAYTHVRQVAGNGWRVGMAVSAGLCLLIAMVDFADIGSTETGVPGFEPSVGWGLWMSLAGSLALVAAVAMKIKNRS